MPLTTRRRRLAVNKLQRLARRRQTGMPAWAGVNDDSDKSTGLQLAGLVTGVAIHQARLVVILITKPSLGTGN